MIRLFELAGWILGGLPTLLVTAMARLAGKLAFELMGKVRRNTIANMSVVLGRPGTDPVVKALARESVAQYAEHSIDLLRFHQDSHFDLRRRVKSIEGWENVVDARKLKRGGIFVTAHFGNWDVAGATVAFDYPLTVIQETFSNPEANELLRRVRADKNVNAVQLGYAARPALRALRRNEYLGVVADRPTPGEGVEVSFFGRRTYVPAGTAKLAIRTGAPIVVGGAIRNPDQTYSAVAYPPIYTDSERSPNASVEGITQAVMGNIEAMIRRRPDQWYMFRPMWPKHLNPQNAVGRSASSPA